MLLNHAWFWPAVVAAASVSAGCAATSSPTPTHEKDHIGNEAILNGQPATDFPEAVIVLIPNSGCSGVLVRPTIVLTAGHCVAGESSWTIVAPNAGFTTSE